MRWDFLFLFQGEKGEGGPRGESGLKGFQGDRGKQGVQGPNGAPGKQVGGSPRIANRNRLPTQEVFGQDRKPLANTCPAFLRVQGSRGSPGDRGKQGVPGLKVNDIQAIPF